MGDLNFFAPYLGEQKSVTNKKILAISLCSFLIVTIAGTQAWNMYNTMSLNKDIKEYEATLNSPEVIEKVKEANDLNKKYDVLNKYDAALDVITNTIDLNDVVSATLLSDINYKVPKDLSFLSISIKEKKLKIQGTAKSRQDISDFQHGLKQLGYLEYVEVASIEVDEQIPGNFIFQLNSILKDVEKNED
ncbi:MAG: PilN domain-containing protein [Clostridiaceae bacterium]